MIKVAICYWGMTRSTKIVYNTHIENLYEVFDENNIIYDIYMHTWITKNNVNIIWENIYNKVDYDEYKLLDPKYYKIENQDDFLKSIDFNNYFNKELYDKYGGDSPYEWKPQLILNNLCALESQKRVYNMVMETNKYYDFIMYIRPDVQILNLFNIDWIINKDDFDIIIPNYDHYEGYNDRFAIIPYNKAYKYSTRIDEIIEFKKNHGRIVSEKYVKYIIEKYYNNVQFIDFFMKIIRPNETI